MKIDLVVLATVMTVMTVFNKTGVFQSKQFLNTLFIKLPNECIQLYITAK